MAWILKGKNKGKEVTLHQWCNNWFSVYAKDGKTLIVSPTNIRLNVER